MKSSCDDFWIAITMNGGIPCLMFLLVGITILLWKVGRLDATRLSPVFAHVRTAWLFSFVAFAFTGFSVMFFGALQPFFFFMIGLGGAIVVIYEKAAFLKRPIRSTGANGAPIRRNAPRPIYPQAAGISPHLL